MSAGVGALGSRVLCSRFHCYHHRFLLSVVECPGTVRTVVHTYCMYCTPYGRISEGASRALVLFPQYDAYPVRVVVLDNLGLANRYVQ